MKRTTKKLVGLLLAASSVTCAASCKSNEVSDTTSTLSEPSISTSVESIATETTTLTSVLTLNTTSALITAADTIAPETQAPAASTQADSTPIEVTTSTAQADSTTKADSTPIEVTTSTAQGITFVDTTVEPQIAVEETTTTTTSDTGDYYEVPEVESTTTTTTAYTEGTLDITNVTDEDSPVLVYGPAPCTAEESMIATADMNCHLYESFAEYADRDNYVSNESSDLHLHHYLGDCSNLNFDGWGFPLQDWFHSNDFGFFVYDGNIYWVNRGVNSSSDEPISIDDDIVVIKLRNDCIYWGLMGNKWYLLYEEDGTYYYLDCAVHLDVADIDPSVDVYGPAPDYDDQTILVYGPANVD